LNSVLANKLSRQIFISLISGVLIGILLNFSIGPEAFKSSFLERSFFLFGNLFLNLLSFLVVPMVLVSLICGTFNVEDSAQFGRVGIKIIFFYTFTTAIAISLALLFSTLIDPGAGFSLISKATFSASTPPPLEQVFLDMIPKNPFKSLSEGNMLQVIFLSLFVGFAITGLGSKGTHIKNAFLSLNDLVMALVVMVMRVAPFGVFFLVARTFGEFGFSAIPPLFKYVMVLIFTIAFHGLLIYSMLLKFFTGLSPWQFAKRFRSVLAFAFSTASSNATVPITLEVTQDRLGVSQKISSFSIPLGATINMDGTAIMQGVATVFIAQAYGIELGLSQFLMVILTATLASIGTAGVPGVGLVTLAMVLKQVGLPVEGIALIVGIDRVLDMLRTALNVTGDAIVTCIVAKQEGELNTKTFNAKQ